MRHLCLANNRDAGPASLINGVAVFFLKVYLLLFVFVFCCFVWYFSVVDCSVQQLCLQSGNFLGRLMECNHSRLWKTVHAVVSTPQCFSSGSGWWGPPCGSDGNYCTKASMQCRSRLPKMFFATKVSTSQNGCLNLVCSAHICSRCCIVTLVWQGHNFTLHVQKLDEDGVTTCGLWGG